MFVDASNETLSNYTRYINHNGTHANLIAKSLPVNPPSSKIGKKKLNTMHKKMSKEEIYGLFRVGFVAVRDISEGEELSFDYGDNYPADWK